MHTGMKETRARSTMITSGSSDVGCLEKFLKALTYSEVATVALDFMWGSAPQL